MLPTARFIFSPLTGCTGGAVSIRVIGGRLVLAWTFSKNGLNLNWCKHLPLWSSNLQLSLFSPGLTSCAEWVSCVCLAVVVTMAEARHVSSLSCVALHCWLFFPLAVSFLPWVHLPRCHTVENRSSLHFLWPCYINCGWLISESKTVLEFGLAV